MIAFRFQYNDEAPVVAGADDLSVLSSIVSMTGTLGPRTVGADAEDDAHFHITVGGLTARATERDEHLRWYQRWEAKTGDRIVVEIIDSDSPDEPIDRSFADGKSPSTDERAYYESLKKAYLALKAKYEPEA